MHFCYLMLTTNDVKVNHLQCPLCICWVRCTPVTARFVTRFNLWLWHDLWPHNASICDPARFVTKSASICDQRYTMILESKLCRGKLVFVFAFIMYTKWYNMIIYIYMNYDMMLIEKVEREVWCCLHWYYFNIMHDIYTSCIIYVYHILCIIHNINWCIFLF